MSAGRRNGGRSGLLRTLAHLLLLRPFIKLLFGVHVHEAGHLRGLDQVILIANHNSHLDTLLLFGLLPAKMISRTHSVAEETYFARSRIVFRLVEFLFRPVWIQRGKPDLSDDPLRGLKAILDEGHSLIVFPEGTRGKPGEMASFKSGIGRLVVDYPNVPIVPVFLKGPERVLPKSSSLLLPFWNYVVVGPPQRCSGGHRDITRQLETVLHDLEAAVSHHHHRPLRERRSGTIAFLGIDGSGKSTVSRRVARALSGEKSVCLIGDELEFYEDNRLSPLQPLGYEIARKAVGRYVKRAKSLKHYKIPKLTELLLRNHLHHEVTKWYTPDLVVMDGSPLLNLMGWTVLYKGEGLDGETCRRVVEILTGSDPNIGPDEPLFDRFGELKALWRLRLNRMVLPEIVLLIDVGPEVACRRIAGRGEQRQVHETEEKLERLRRSYLAVIKAVGEKCGVRAAVVEGEAPLEEVVERSLEFATRQLERKGDEDE